MPALKAVAVGTNLFGKSPTTDRYKALLADPKYASVIGYLPPEVQTALLEGESPANDFVMQIGSNGVKFAQRVDPGDVGVFSKPGGALVNAPRGGGGTLVMHNYRMDMGPIYDAWRAGLLG